MQETQEMQAPSLGQQDPLARGLATRFSILAWRIPWIEEPGRLQSIGQQRDRHDWEPEHAHHIRFLSTLRKKMGSISCRLKCKSRLQSQYLLGFPEIVFTLVSSISFSIVVQQWLIWRRVQEEKSDRTDPPKKAWSFFVLFLSLRLKLQGSTSLLSLLFPPRPLILASNRLS